MENIGIRQLSLDRAPDPAQTLLDLSKFAKGVSSDKYMTGELFDRLENRVADLLGKEKALYLPSGKLAQMAALKSLCRRAGCSRIAMHPRAHLEEYEARAYSELWGLTSAQLGGYDRLPNKLDIQSITEQLGVVTIELPTRKLGCLLPTWNQLTEISKYSRQKNIFLHMDGARLWESQPYYGKELSEISNLFDTVYVALDKGLGALGGAVLAGPTWVIEEAKVWQRRAGGRALRSFPYILSALKALDERLPRMGEFHDKARSVAASLENVSTLSISPNPPHANAFLVSMKGKMDSAVNARDVVAKEHNIWLFDNAIDAVDQNILRFEVTVRGAAIELSDEEIKRAITRFSEVVCGN